MSNIVNTLNEIVDSQCVVERISMRCKDTRCTINLKELGSSLVVNFDSEHSFLKKPALRPDFLIVSETPKNDDRLFMVEFSKGSNKKTSKKKEQIQAGFDALEKLIREKGRVKNFKHADIYPVYWGPTKKGEKDRKTIPVFKFLYREYKLKYLGCNEPISKLYKNRGRGNHV